MEETLQKQKPAVKRRKKLKLRWIVLPMLLLAAVGGVLTMRQMRGRQATETVTYQEAAVQRRNITNSLTGSGTLQPANAYTVTTLVSGEILSDPFEEGDEVVENQLLYEIDASATASARTQAQSSYNKAVKNKYPAATATGVISEVYVRDGDTVKTGEQLCRIRESTDIFGDFQFSYTDPAVFCAGQAAQVYVDGYEGVVTGTVERVGSSGLANATGMVMTTVRVAFENPGMVMEGDLGRVVIDGHTSYGWATLQVGAYTTVTAGAAGEIAGMSCMPGDLVAEGDRLCTITGESVDDAIENAQTNLENAQDKLDDYRITSPISGTVIEKYAKAGDNAGTDGNSTMCIIYDLSYLEMTLNIDELDIRTVAVGQDVSVTADAVEGKTYQGVVTKVSVVGSTIGGTTTYPVTIRIDETDGLLPGMNVDAEIVLSGTENVLTVPNSAVNRGNTVLITAESPSAVHALEQEAPDGYVYVAVELGESDDDYIEVVSGLQEGDTVAYLRTSSGGNGAMMMPGMAMGGMPSGGVPSGGMPSGGMPSGGFPSGGMPSGSGGNRGGSSGGGFPR